MSWRDDLKRAIGPGWTTRLRVLARGGSLPRWGNLRRTRPFSSQFGFDRGLPIDRFYLRRFLDENRDLIRGDVLEIQTAETARRFGRQLGDLHSVDVDPRFRPTYVCDLARADAIPTARYDCFLLPSTLNHLADVEAGMREAHRVVRPGGAILATVAALVPLTGDAADYWRSSAGGWRLLAERAWAGSEITVAARGNCLAATAAMLGLAWEELDEAELAVDDPRYPVLVTLRCIKRERA